MDLIIKNGTIVSPTATFKADVCVDNGKIVAITADAGTDADKVVDASGKMVLPGAIDAHTHLAMPFGGTISSDDYYAGTRAAACGGTTTVFDFILQDFGETMVDAIKRRDALCAPDAAVDYGIPRCRKGRFKRTYRHYRGRCKLRCIFVQGIYGLRLRCNRRRILQGT